MSLTNAQQLRYLLTGRLPAPLTPVEEARAIIEGLGWDEETAASKLWVHKGYLQRVLAGKTHSALLLKRIRQIKESAA